MAPKRHDSFLVNERCNLTRMVKTLANLRPYMTEHHWDLLQRTLFAYYLGLTGLIQEWVFLDELMKTYNLDDQTFIIEMSSLFTTKYLLYASVKRNNIFFSRERDYFTIKSQVSNIFIPFRPQVVSFILGLLCRGLNVDVGVPSPRRVQEPAKHPSLWSGTCTKHVTATMKQ